MSEYRRHHHLLLHGGKPNIGDNLLFYQISVCSLLSDTVPGPSWEGDVGVGVASLGGDINHQVTLEVDN